MFWISKYSGTVIVPFQLPREGVLHCTVHWQQKLRCRMEGTDMIARTPLFLQDRLPTNAMRGSPSCIGKGQGSLANEGTLRARVTFPHIDPIFSDPRLPPRSSPGKLTFRSMGAGQVAIFCFLARHGLKRITLAPTVNTPGRPRQLQSSPVHSRTEPRINPTDPGSKLSNRRMETPAR